MGVRRGVGPPSLSPTGLDSVTEAASKVIRNVVPGWHPGSTVETTRAVYVWGRTLWSVPSSVAVVEPRVVWHSEKPVF